MKLHQPCNEGIRFLAGYSSQRPLNNMKEMLQCISQGFGERPEVYGPGGHNGIDLVYADATPLLAPFDAEVEYREEKYQGKFSGYGKHLIFTNKDLGFKVVYAHLKENESGDTVRSGDRVGLGDSTGFSTGPHLHLTLKRVDANGDVLDRDNGHDGAIDPLPYLAFIMFELVQVPGSQEVWLVRGGKKTHIYNQGALMSISDFASIKPITQSALDAMPDTGVELATIVKE